MAKDETSKINPNIQALRGMACLAVFFSHLIGILPKGLLIGNLSLNSTPLRLIWGGDSAVIVFFFISGFFFYKKKELSALNYIQEIVNRHIRIYVVFLIVLVIGVLARITCPDYSYNGLSTWICSFWSEEISWKEVFKHLFLISSFDSHYIDPPLWTLRIELRMIFVLPLCRWLIEKIRFPWLVYVVCLILGLFVGTFSYLNVFVLGMLLRYYLQNDKFRTWMIELSSMKKIALCLLGILLLDTEYILMYIHASVNSFYVSAITAVGAMLIFALLYVNNSPIKCLYPLSRLGDISYPSYLMHFIVLLWFRFTISYIGVLFYGLICFLCTLLFSFALSRYDKVVQMKFMRISNNMFDRLKSSAVRRGKST